MQPETLAGMFGLGGALVGAAVSTGAVVWQQRKIARESERVHLLGLAEAAANEVIRLSYELEDHFDKRVADHQTLDRREWRDELQRLNRALEEQALRFPDMEVQRFLASVHHDLLSPEKLFMHADERRTVSRYQLICSDMKLVMGTVLRRQPFPSRSIWNNSRYLFRPL
ncbi:hypothetical protein [Streptomyces sp. ME19-01-6]|uniref:hypothetical protein n=1 Tax=Streptomyces sp. ME19-01-6 TaxID=3028686 RepID=UPI0029B3DED5|nr:hypothetical protein [Streptomyces sp. ME19-01-6]MDX3233223.1 hypothetical protein [Streptomyces sp. ME19-01-6]